MNYLITVVGITIVSLLLANSFFLQTQNPYEIDAYGQGDDEEIENSQEATEEEEDAMEEADDEDD